MKEKTKCPKCESILYYSVGKMIPYENCIFDAMIARLTAKSKGEKPPKDKPHKYFIYRRCIKDDCNYINEEVYDGTYYDDKETAETIALSLNKQI